MICRRLVLVMIAMAVFVGACSDASTVSVTAAAGTGVPVTTSLEPASSSSTPTATVTTTTNSALASIRAQIATASTDVCTLVSAQNVGLSFAQTVPLTTQPMGEARGPACGFPNPNAGGYLLVIQFQDLAYWGGHASTGKRVEGLGLDAVLSPTLPELYVLDIDRGHMIMFLAADRPVGYADSLLRVAALIYGKSPASVRVAQ